MCSYLRNMGKLTFKTCHTWRNTGNKEFQFRVTQQMSPLCRLWVECRLLCDAHHLAQSMYIHNSSYRRTQCSICLPCSQFNFLLASSSAIFSSCRGPLLSNVIPPYSSSRLPKCTFFNTLVVLFESSYVLGSCWQVPSALTLYCTCTFNHTINSHVSGALPLILQKYTNIDLMI